jgi:hypothetical protein
MLLGFASPDSNVYLILAGIGTILFLAKFVLLLLGAGGHDSGMDALHAGGDVTIHVGDTGMGHADVHSDQHSDSTASFQLLSIQSVLGFFMGLGWMGLAMIEQWHYARWPAMAAAFGFGLAMMLLTAVLSFYMRRLDKDPHYDVHSCVGSLGRVYLTIPEKGKGMGQVEVNCSGRRMIIQATSTGPTLAAFTSVKVLAVDDLSHLIVEPEGTAPLKT